MKFAYPCAAPHERVRVRTYWAIGEFFYAVDHIFGLVIRYSLIVSAVIHVLLSISPLFFSNSPCNTPMTPLLHAAIIILRIIFLLPWWCLRWLRGESFDLTASVLQRHPLLPCAFILDRGGEAGGEA